MESAGLPTRYGVLHGAVRAEYTSDGSLSECTLAEENRIETPCGLLTPQFEDDGVRRKFISSLSFYKSGALRSISMQRSETVTTPLGPMHAELVTFYESGSVKRVFPLNGKISGFWSELNEYKLAPLLSLELPVGKISIKPISLYFYESGEIKSVTLWPAERLLVPTPIGVIEARTGLSFYKNGAVRSLEPLRPTGIITPIGALTAFDPEALGICADNNSLVFEENGAVGSLITSVDCVRVTTAGGTVITHSPGQAVSHFSDELSRIIPMRVRFTNSFVQFDEGEEYDLTQNSFTIVKLEQKGKKIGNDCPGCGQAEV